MPQVLTLNPPAPATTTITIVAGGEPVQAADVWVTSDAEGGIIIDGPATTNADGAVPMLLIDKVDYFLWMNAVGCEPILGQPFTAATDRQA